MSRRFTIEVGSLPDLPGMMLATVEALREIGGSATIQELDEKVAEIENVTEEEQSYIMSDNDPRPRMNYYLAWARTYLKRGGALENSGRGVWALTEKGKGISEYAQTKAIHDQVGQEERERARLKRKRAKEQEIVSSSSAKDIFEGSSGGETPDTTTWRDSLLSTLKEMDPNAFERLAQRLLREAGERLIYRFGYADFGAIGRGSCGRGAILR